MKGNEQYCKFLDHSTTFLMLYYVVETKWRTVKSRLISANIATSKKQNKKKYPKSGRRFWINSLILNLILEFRFGVSIRVSNSSLLSGRRWQVAFGRKQISSAHLVSRRLFFPDLANSRRQIVMSVKPLTAIERSPTGVRRLSICQHIYVHCTSVRPAALSPWLRFGTEFGLELSICLNIGFIRRNLRKCAQNDITWVQSSLSQQWTKQWQIFALFRKPVCPEEYYTMFDWSLIIGRH